MKICKLSIFSLYFFFVRFLSVLSLHPSVRFSSFSSSQASVGRDGGGLQGRGGRKLVSHFLTHCIDLLSPFLFLHYSSNSSSHAFVSFHVLSLLFVSCTFKSSIFCRDLRVLFFLIDSITLIWSFAFFFHCSFGFFIKGEERKREKKRGINREQTSVPKVCFHEFSSGRSANKTGGWRKKKRAQDNQFQLRRARNS